MFVVFDTEYISDKGMCEEGFSGWKNREVVQIAALKINDKLEVFEEFNVFAKPIINPAMSKYFVDLLGFDSEFLDVNGIGFVEAYERFKEFVGDLMCYSHGWSLNTVDIADGDVMNETLSHYGITDNNQPKYANIAPWFRQQYLEKGIDIKMQCSGEVAKLLGREENIKALGLSLHNALYDVYSLLEGLRELEFK